MASKKGKLEIFCSHGDMPKKEIHNLLHCTETSRIERIVSMGNMDWINASRYDSLD